MRKEDIFDRVVSVSWLGVVSSDLLQISGDVALCLIWIRYSTHQFICIFLIY